MITYGDLVFAACKDGETYEQLLSEGYKDAHEESVKTRVCIVGKMMRLNSGDPGLPGLPWQATAIHYVTAQLIDRGMPSDLDWWARVAAREITFASDTGMLRSREDILAFMGREITIGLSDPADRQRLEVFFNGTKPHHTDPVGG